MPSGGASVLNVAPIRFKSQVDDMDLSTGSKGATGHAVETDVDIDLREVYFLIMHFLSAGPCQRTCGQFWNELLEHRLLPRRYHAWFSRSGLHSGNDDDDGISFPLNYNKLVDRYALYVFLFVLSGFLTIFLNQVEEFIAILLLMEL